MRQVCHALSTIPGIDFPSQVFPLDAAWTVVPGAHSPLPYHSNTSTSPSGCGSSLTVQNEGHKPGYKQLSLIRASHVVLIVPRQLPRNLPLKYSPFSRVACRTRLEFPSRKTFSARYIPSTGGNTPSCPASGVRFARSGALAAD